MPDQPPALTPPEGWWEQAFVNLPSFSESCGHPCGNRQMLALVAYDITDPKRLVKVAKLCEDFGFRIQYSVFECRLEAGAFDRFWTSLTDLIDQGEDRVVAYRICANCSREVRDAGMQVHSAKAIAYVF